MEIENVFEVGAPPDRVYAFLLDVEHIVGCVPGAELVETIDDNTFKGRVRIKVGPITVSYTGNAEIADRDAETHTAVLKASGRETTGSGSARATANMSVNAKDGGSEVKFVTEFAVAGRVANFGRGVMEDVSRRLVGQMANCIKANLEVEEGGTPESPAVGGASSEGSSGTPAAESAPAEPPAASTPPEPAPGGEPPHEAAIPPAAPMGGIAAPATTGEAVTGDAGSAAAPAPAETAPAEPPPAETPPAETPAAEAVAAETAAPAASPPPRRPPATAEAKPINGLSLFFAILGDRIKRLFGGRRS